MLKTVHGVVELRLKAWGNLWRPGGLASGLPMIGRAETTLSLNPLACIAKSQLESIGH